jgi:outer membrane murein-binding lipoprotein Lpp
MAKLNTFVIIGVLIAGLALAGGFSKRVVQTVSTTATWTNTVANFSVDRMSVVFPAAVANTSVFYHVAYLVNDAGTTNVITNLVASVGSDSLTTFTWDNDTPLAVLKGDHIIVVNDNTNAATFISDMNTLD